MVMIDIQLPEGLAEKARAAGLLTSEKIAALLEAELARQRQAAAGRLLEATDDLQAAAREDFGDMTEEEFMQMINEDIRAVREAKRTRGDKQDS
jgi:hypothetical protein